MNSYDCCNNNSISKKPITSIVSLLKLVSEKSRLQILCILDTGTHCVCELMDHTQLSQSLISHHLKDLKSHNIVVDQKVGKRVNYSLTPVGKKIFTTIFKLL